MPGRDFRIHRYSNVLHENTHGSQWCPTNSSGSKVLVACSVSEITTFSGGAAAGEHPGLHFLLPRGRAVATPSQEPTVLQLVHEIVSGLNCVFLHANCSMSMKTWKHFQGKTTSHMSWHPSGRLTTSNIFHEAKTIVVPVSL